MANKKFPTGMLILDSLEDNDALLISDESDASISKFITLSTLVDKVSADIGITSKANTTDLLAHTSDTSNPHTVTSLQLNLDQVDNTSDLNKPISTATQSALDNKLSNVVEDLTPQLGGDLDGQGNIVSNVELKGYSEALVTTTSTGGILTLDYSQGNVFQSVLHENVTSIVISNPPTTGKSGSITLKLTQDSVTPRTVTWGTGYMWGGGDIPVMSDTVGVIDFYTLTSFDGGSIWFGFVAGQVMT